MTESKGWDLWRNTLNSARWVVAPMVDQSELPWRLLSRKYGAELCYTPMLHASVFARDAVYRRDTLKTCAEDRPLIVQFCANDPEILVKAALLAEDQCDAIDLNIGCPQNIAKRGHYGVFLQDDWPLLHKMVSLCRARLNVPVTCKIRVYHSIDKTVEYAKMLEDAGCQLLTVHGRTKEQKGPLTGLANWEHIKAVRQNVNIPVFANGNIQYLSDVDRCIAETGVQGVMIAEGNLHNPALFRGLNPPVWQMVDEYLDFTRTYPCNVSYMRGHAFKIMHHALEVHKDARDMVGVCKTFEDFRAATKFLQQKCQADMEKYEKDPSTFHSELPLPYWLCQPYVRPSPKAEETEEKKAERVRLKLKRNAELGLVTTENLSRNQLKKKRRNPHKNFDPQQKSRYTTCATCCNPRGIRCDFGLCKSCCKKKSLLEILDCQGHNFKFRTRTLNKKQENGHYGVNSDTNIADHGVTDSVTNDANSDTGIADHGVTDSVTNDANSDTGIADHGVTDSVTNDANSDTGIADHGVTDSVTKDANSDTGIDDHGVADSVTKDANSDTGIDDHGVADTVTNDANSDTGIADHGVTDTVTNDANSDVGIADHGVAGCVISDKQDHCEMNSEMNGDVTDTAASGYRTLSENQTDDTQTLSRDEHICEEAVS